MSVTQSAGRPSTEMGAGQRFCSRFQMNSPLNRTTVLRVIVAITLMHAQVGALLAVQQAPVTS